MLTSPCFYTQVINKSGIIANNWDSIFGTVATNAYICTQKEDIGNPEHWCKLEFKSMAANPLYMGHHIYRGLRKDPMMSHLDSLLKSLVIPEGIDSIRPYSFARADIEELEIPDTTSCIATHAFYECENLRIVHLPASLKRIEVGAFSGCFRLETFIIDNPDIIIEGANFSTYQGQLIVKPGMTEIFRQNPIWGKCTIIERL